MISLLEVENELSTQKRKRYVRQEWVFWSDIFNVYDKDWLLVDYNLTNIRYSSERVLMAATERRIQKHVDKVVNKNGRKAHVYCMTC